MFKSKDKYFGGGICYISNTGKKYNRHDFTCITSPELAYSVFTSIDGSDLLDFLKDNLVYTSKGEWVLPD